MPKYKFSDIAINSTEKKKPVEEDKYTYIGLEHLDSGTLTVSRWGADVAPIGEKLIMKKGDVLFGKRRAYQKKVGIAPFDGIFSAHGMVLRPKEKVVTKEYFPLFISSDYFLDKAIQISVGSLSPTINWKDLQNLEFEIPSIEEQQRVAPVIWAAIDTKNAYNKLLHETDELIKSQFIEMFGNITDRASIESISVNGPQNGFYRKDDGSAPNTHIVKMKELFANECIADETSFDMVNMSSVEQKRFALTSADLLFGRRSLVVEGAGKCRRVGDVKIPLAFESSLLRITLDTTRILPRYVQVWFETDEGKQAIASIRAVTTIAGIKGSDLKKIKLPVPPLEQQKKFISFVRQSDKSKLELKQAIEGVDNLIRSLIQQELK
ncbi:MAG: restriction endonuclease subunit S [Lachnospiraceae bacterium]|nr:restriction endonuclease subunit S [Lachnospiraceae bacterium]